MRALTIVFVVLLSGPCLAGEPEPAKPDPGEMRNATLRDVPDNTWFKLKATIPAERKGGAEVFPAYDARNRILLHYAGCTTPYVNEGWVFDLGTEKWKMLWTHDANDKGRPGPTCSRAMAFDSKRGLIWAYGGAHSMGALIGLWSYDAAANKWTSVEGKWAKPGRDSRPPSANGMVYDSANDLLVSVGPGPSAQGDVHVFDIQKQEWRGGACDPVKDLKDYHLMNYIPLTFDPGTARSVYFNGKSETWTYDAKSDVWTKMNPKAEPPGPRIHAGMAYDSRNKVHLLCGGHGLESGKGTYNDLWAYDVAANTWTEMKPKDPTAFPARAGGLPVGQTMLFWYDTEHNVSVLVSHYPGSPMWAYRYKK